MATKQEVEEYLNDLFVKIDIFGILFIDQRSKNHQTLLELEITPAKRKEVIRSLKTEDYSEGPLEEKMRELLPMWVFGKEFKNKEIYIKVSMGQPNSTAVCILFHIAEYPIDYPLKN